MYYTSFRIYPLENSWTRLITWGHSMIHDIHTLLHTPQGCCNSKYQDDKKRGYFWPQCNIYVTCNICNRQKSWSGVHKYISTRQ